MNEKSEVNNLFDNVLNKFLSNKMEALTMLYLENHDLTEKSPEDIVRLYLDTEFKIRAKFNEISNLSKTYRSKGY